MQICINPIGRSAVGFFGNMVTLVTDSSAINLRIVPMYVP